jgi:hypothetical protein
MLQSAFANAARLAGIGPVPMMLGSTPEVAQDTILAMGVMPRAFAVAALINTATAAPSLMPDAFQAVTLPSLSNAGRSPLRVSMVVP